MSEPFPTVGPGLDPRLRQAVLKRVVRTVAWHFGSISGLPVAPAASDAEAAAAAVAEIDLELGRDPAALLDLVVPMLRDGIVHTGHPGYFGHFDSAPAFMGVVGEALVATFNPQLSVISHAPGPVAIEAACLDLLLRRVGLPLGSVGQFTSGGSEANLLGLLVALHRAFPAVGADGVHALTRRPVLYASTGAHHSITKVARAIGLGATAVRGVSVDTTHRLDPALLRRLVSKDRAAGLAPFAVVATAGTTSCGAIDPLAELAAFTRQEGLHLHVDAAWAGAVALSDHYRYLLDGIDLADSVTIDYHKWLSAPMTAGAFLTPHAADLRRAFAIDAGFKPSADTSDPFTPGLQESRRHVGLKIFLALATAGRRGVGAQIDRDVHLGHQLRAGLADDGWRILNQTELPIVCFDDPGVEPKRSDAHLRSIVDGIKATGRAWISLVPLGGRLAVRTCITSYRTDEAMVAWLRGTLIEARASSSAHRRDGRLLAPWRGRRR